MAATTGPYLDRSGLVFYYDTRNTNESFKGRPTTNFFPDGHFPNGQHMASEGGSNPTNTIIPLKNPGNSSYVLQQTMGSASTEYQINLSSQLAANTTYVLSGWYGESNDYTGAQRMFHCRAWSNSGAHRALGTGIYNVIKTVVVDGITWRYCYVTITTPSDYSNTFNWYVGYAGDSYQGARYYTNLQMEQGTYPSQFIDGTRSSTESIIDFTGNYSIDASNVSFVNEQLDFDGTSDDLRLTSDQVIKTTGGWTVESLVKYDSVAGGYNNVTSPANFIGSDSIVYNSWYWSVLNNKLALWNRSPGTWRYGSTTIQPNTWYHTALVCYDSGTQYQMYLNGVAEGGDHTTYSWNAAYAGLRIRYVGRGNGSNVRLVNGQIPMTRVYNRALSADEIAVNASMFKNLTG